MLRIVGVKSLPDEVFPAAREVIGYCGRSKGAQDADRVAFEDGLAEAFVVPVVAALVGGAALLVDGVVVLVASAVAGGGRRAAWESALLAQSGHL